MPDYSKLRELMSHRVTVEYDTGARITGYLARCLPGEGQVQLVHLTNASVYSADGAVLETHNALSVCPNGLAGVRLDEGPRGA